MANYTVKINLITGTVINETITDATLAGIISGADVLDGSDQQLAEVRASGYFKTVSATELINYSPYIIGSIQVEEDV